MTQTLYNQDFYAWTQQQAALLQAEELEKLDLPNLIEGCFPQNLPVVD